MRLIRSWRHALLSVAAGLTLLMVLPSCDSDDGDTIAISDRRKICVLLSSGGLGDDGYNDMIWRGLQNFTLSHPDVWLQCFSPATAEEGIRLMNSWIELHKGEKLLCVLAGSEYEQQAATLYGLRPADSTATWRPDFLLFESDNPERLPLTSFSMSLYGAAWLCGRSVKEMQLTRPLCLLAHSHDQPTQTAAQGFFDGYGEVTDTACMAADWSGFSMPETAYQRMYDYAQNHDFIFGVAGASNLGVYRYLREKPDGVWTIGRGWNQYTQSSQIIGNMVKRIDLVVEDYLTLWADGSEMPQVRLLGLESGYVDWQVAPAYADRLEDFVNNIRQEAVNEENKYVCKP